MFEVKWTGKWPCLCYGKWIIKKDGVDVSKYIPAELQNDHMNTYGEYSDWHFEKDWDVVWDDYKDGLLSDQWIEANPWITNICKNYNEMIELYDEINASDWRHGSCGGCI